MPKRTTKTSTAKQFWESPRDPQYHVIVELQRAKTFRDFKFKIGPMLATVPEARQDIFDTSLGLLLDSGLPPFDVIRALSSWLTNDKIPVNPHVLSNFDRFHRKFGPLIISRYEGMRLAQI